MNNIKYQLNLKRSIKLLYSIKLNKYSTKINIPKRIEREPTDILKALASTVSRDPTAPHYKFHDDQFLIPMSNISKRTYAVAQEAGRKAAKWIFQENSKLFQHKVADPKIDAFIPQIHYNENSEVDANSLKDVVQRLEVSEAILVYNLLKSKNIEIPNDVKFDFIQMLCFFNHEDTLDESLVEERWFRQSTTGKERQRKTWKDSGLAEELFHEIEPKDAKLYSAMIRGTAKYFQVEKAWSLFQEGLDKGLTLDVATYNSIIEAVPFIKESGESRRQLVQEILELMSQRNIKPNLETLNSVLSTISSISIFKLSRNYALRTLAEFKILGIEPSLASWYYILIIFCKERGPVSHVLVDILNEIDGNSFEIYDFKDTFFFVTAMDVCRNMLHDKDLARKLDKLLHTGNNYNLIGDSYKESVYYRNYLTLLCQTEPLDKFLIETYDVLVPNIYNPEPSVIDEILKAIDSNGALIYVPKIWNDIVIFDHTNRENLLHRILNIMVDNPPNLEIETQKNLNSVFSQIGWDIWNTIEDQPPMRTQKISWSCEMLSSILELCSRNGDFEKCSIVFEKLDKNQHKIVGSINYKSMQSYIKLCIENKEPQKAISCLNYCVENALPDCEEFGKLILNSMTLNEKQEQKLKSLFGNDVCL